MLGDIVPNSNPMGGSNANGAGTAVKPAPTSRPTSASYGASNFGPAKPTPVRPIPRPIQQAQAPVAAQPQPIQRTAPVEPAAAAPVVKAKPVALLPAHTKRPGKLPLILTITGVVIFIGGVVALFVYALSGS